MLMTRHFIVASLAPRGAAYRPLAKVSERPPAAIREQPLRGVLLASYILDSSQQFRHSPEALPELTGREPPRSSR